MAPNGDAAGAAMAASPKTTNNKGPRRHNSSSSKPRRLSMEGLQRAMSDLALELARDRNAAGAAAKQPQLASVAEQQQQQVVVEEARCECCGMQEECTPAYVRRVRDRYCGRWVCGLCAEAVNGEAEKMSTTRHGGAGGRSSSTEDALAAHMAVCGRFNRVGRANPVLMQTEAMREILRKRSRSNSPREHGGPAGLTRTNSCIPAMTKDGFDRVPAASSPPIVGRTVSSLLH